MPESRRGAPQPPPVWVCARRTYAAPARYAEDAPRPTGSAPVRTADVAAASAAQHSGAVPERRGYADTAGGRCCSNPGASSGLNTRGGAANAGASAAGTSPANLRSLSAHSAGCGASNAGAATANRSGAGSVGAGSAGAGYAATGSGYAGAGSGYAGAGSGYAGSAGAGTATLHNPLSSTGKREFASGLSQASGSSIHRGQTEASSPERAHFSLMPGPRRESGARRDSGARREVAAHVDPPGPYGSLIRKDAPTLLTTKSQRDFAQTTSRSAKWLSSRGRPAKTQDAACGADEPEPEPEPPPPPPVLTS